MKKVMHQPKLQKENKTTSNGVKILDGNKLSGKILKNLRKEIQNKRLKLRLAVILAGENLVSKIFIQQKEKACRIAGIDFKLFKFPSRISAQQFRKEVSKIAVDPLNSGVIIQLPLPARLDLQDIFNLIPPEKDVDILSEINLGKFYADNLSILPPTVRGIHCLLRENKIPLKGRNIVIVGAGRLVGQPLSTHFLHERATVSALNQFTKDASSFTKKADILISGVGKPNLITGRTVKKGVVVIDAGSGLQKGKIAGDIDFKSVSKKASFITPVPGGVGPMTVACLLENLVIANLRK